MISINSKREANFGVTLTPCCLKENTYVARVPRKTVTTDQILDLVAAHNQGIDRYQVGHAMELLKKEVLEQAELGFAVDIMDICKLYIAPRSSVKSLTPGSECVSGFEARFTVNEELREKLKRVTASVTAVVDSSPQISEIQNLLDGSTDGKLKATFSVRIKGKKLKVAGENSGIFFVPCLEDGQPSDDESSWVKVPESFVTRNTDGFLEFFIPRDIECGRKFFLAVRTSVRGSVVLKHPSTGFSTLAVTIEE